MNFYCNQTIKKVTGVCFLAAFFLAALFFFWLLGFIFGRNFLLELVHKKTAVYTVGIFSIQLQLQLHSASTGVQLMDIH
jgi:hypothetical protein